MEYLITTPDGKGSVTTKEMMVETAGGSLSWTAGRKWGVSLFKDMAAKKIDLSSLQFAPLQ